MKRFSENRSLVLRKQDGEWMRTVLLQPCSHDTGAWEIRGDKDSTRAAISRRVGVFGPKPSGAALNAAASGVLASSVSRLFNWRSALIVVRIPLPLRDGEFADHTIVTADHGIF